MINTYCEISFGCPFPDWKSELTVMVRNPKYPEESRTIVNPERSRGIQNDPSIKGGLGGHFLDWRSEMTVMVRSVDPGVGFRV